MITQEMKNILKKFNEIVINSRTQIPIDNKSQIITVDIGKELGIISYEFPTV
jgi:hypothetical protein